MKRKGLSVDQKREKMLAVFHDRKEIFNLKEIEKFSVKAGIVLPTVKDVLLALISDDLVDSDKIGAANFYWSLPSKSYQILKIKLSEIAIKQEKLKEQRELLSSKILEAQEGREESKERTKNLQRLEALQKTFAIQNKEIQTYMRNDPERKKQLEDEAIQLKKKANFWTDQIFCLKQWLQQKMFQSDEDLEKAFQIPVDLDEIQ